MVHQSNKFCKFISSILHFVYKKWSRYMNSLKRANYSTFNYVTIGHFYSSHVWKLYFYVVVQSFSCIRLFTTPWTAAWQTSLSFTVSWSLLKPMYIKSYMTSNHLILCRPLCLQSSPASGSFPVCWLFISGGQSIGASSSASVFPMNI